MLGKKRRFDLRQFLMAYETPPTDPVGAGGGGTDPAATDPVDPKAPPAADPAKPPADPASPDLPAEVKAQLAELETLKKAQAKAEKIAAEKAKAEADAKRTTEEQLAVSRQEVEALKQRQAVRDLRDELGMTGAIYTRLASTVTETDEEKIKETLTAIKAEVDGHIAAEVEKAKGQRGTGGNISPTNAKPAKEEKSEGLFTSLFGGK